jgi:hypothetical protein
MKEKNDNDKSSKPVDTKGLKPEIKKSIADKKNALESGKIIKK